MTALTWHYLTWHYSRGARDFLRIWTNLLWFAWHFFSVGLLLSTLVSPFRRIRDERKKGFDPGAFAESIIVNMLMRLVGIIVRSVLIAMGLLVCSFLMVTGAVLFVAWFAAPLLYVLMMVTGFYTLIT